MCLVVMESCVSGKKKKKDVESRESNSLTRRYNTE